VSLPPVSPQILFDFSKSMDYLFQNSPTGISRMDVEYAGFLASRPDLLHAGLHRRFGIVTRFSPRWLAGAVRRIRSEWDLGSKEALLPRVLDWLAGRGAPTARIHPARSPRMAFWRKASRFGFNWPYHTVWQRAPWGSIYLNISYAGLESDRHLRWLKKRPDIAPVFMIHDLLPLDRPELFWDGVEGSFPAKMRRLVACAKLVLVPSDAVKTRVEAFATQNGRHDLRVVTLPSPPAQEFLLPPPSVPPGLPAYFVVCGTLEPRKNHALLLSVWEEMVRRGGPVPKLLVIGGRGWKCAPLLERLAAPALRGHVVEVSGLSTQDLRSLICGARALLMPSLDEGYGMPLVEALALQVPVIASDIPVFREVARGAARLVPLSDQAAWQDAITALAQEGMPRAEALEKARRFAPVLWPDYFSSLLEILAPLAATGPTGSP
jgi:glycosyltransferase involved in cell wall biosynthesis